MALKGQQIFTRAALEAMAARYDDSSEVYSLEQNANNRGGAEAQS
jgi:hypothetical protein